MDGDALRSGEFDDGISKWRDHTDDARCGYGTKVSSNQTSRKSLYAQITTSTLRRTSFHSLELLPRMQSVAPLLRLPSVSWQSVIRLALIEHLYFMTCSPMRPCRMRCSAVERRDGQAASLRSPVTGRPLWMAFRSVSSTETQVALTICYVAMHNLDAFRGTRSA